MEKGMTYDTSRHVVVANDIITGKQISSLQHGRVIRFLISQIAMQDNDLRTYTCRIQEFANFVGIDSSNLYKDVVNFCDGLLDTKVYVGTGNPKQPWKMFHWISCAQYDGAGNLTLRLSDEIRPYVIELDSYFTQYKLGDILSMQSHYAIRLYELIKCQDGKTHEELSYHEFTIQYLKERLGCETKYKQIVEFKKNVINIGVREINKKSDIRIEPKYLKTGRSITSVRFYIHTNYHSKEEPLEGQITFEEV